MCDTIADRLRLLLLVRLMFAVALSSRGTWAPPPARASCRHVVVVAFVPSFTGLRPTSVDGSRDVV